MRQVTALLCGSLLSMPEQRPEQSAEGEATTRPELRIAVSTGGSKRQAWGWTLATILVSGLVLYAARAQVAQALDRWVPLPERSEPAPVEAAEPPPEPEPVAEEPVEPRWSSADVEAALVPLPAEAEALIAEGREEVAQFKGLGAADETRALLARNRWTMWGRIWRNRVDHLRRRLPPIEDCEIHVETEPICRALLESLAVLERVPTAERRADAVEILDEAETVMAELRAAREAALEEDAALEQETTVVSEPISP